LLVLVPDPHRELAYIREVGCLAPVPKHDRLRRVGAPHGHGGVARPRRVLDERFLRHPTQIEPPLDIDHPLREPVGRRDRSTRGRHLQTGTVEVEVVGVRPHLEVEEDGSVLSEVARSRRDPEPCLPVLEKVAGPLGEAVVDLGAVSWVDLLEVEREALLVELDALTAEGGGRVGELLQDTRRRAVLPPLRELAHRPHLDPPGRRDRVAHDPTQHATIGPLHPDGAHDAHPRERERAGAGARHGQPEVLHGAQVGVGERPPDFDCLHGLDGDAVEAEVGPRLGLVAREEGAAAVEADDVAQMFLGPTERSVAVEVLGVLAAVVPGAHGSTVPPAVDPSRLREAALSPHPPLVRLVAPDLAALRVGFLVQEVETPGHAVRLHPARRPRRRREEGVFADHAEVDDEGERLPTGDVELEELALRQVGAPLRQRRGDRGEARSARDLSGAQREEEARLADLAPGHPDLSIDVLSRQEALLDADTVPRRPLEDPLMLPDDLGERFHVERRREHVFRAVPEGGRAPPRPVPRQERERPLGRGVEVVQEDLVLRVRIGNRERRLAVDRDRAGNGRAEPRHPAQRTVQPLHARREATGEADQPDRAGLEAEGGPTHERLLVPVEAGQVQLPALAEPGPTRETEDGDGRLPEELLLLPRGAELGVGPRREERFGLEEANLADVVVDLVVDALDEELVPEEDPLAPVPHPERTQREGGDQALALAPEGDGDAEAPAVVPLEGVRIVVDRSVGIRAEELRGVVLVQAEPLEGWRTLEGLERRKDEEGSLHGGLVLEEVAAGGVEHRGVHLINRRFPVEAEEAEVGDVLARLRPDEGASGRALAE